MWYHKRNSILWLIAPIILLQCCNNKKDSAISAKDPFYYQIESSFPEIEIKSTGNVNQTFGIVPTHLIVDSTYGYLIAANRENNSIHLFTPKGDSLLDIVGREGPGPAEFNSINQLYIGYDKALYILDGNLDRITKFRIENQKLHYVTSFTMKPGLDIQVRDIYVTEYGNFGVFHRIDDHKTWDESYHLYLLDDNFAPAKHLLEIPGNQKLKLSENFYIDHSLGRITYWDIEGKWFYHISSKSSAIKMYNIKTGKLKIQQYFTLKNRTNTEKTKRFFKKRFATLIDDRPDVEKAIQKTELLPKFDGFLVSRNRILFNVFHVEGKGGRVISVNQTTGQVKYIKTPSYIWNIALGNNIMFGVVSSPKKGHRIKILYFN